MRGVYESVGGVRLGMGVIGPGVYPADVGPRAPRDPATAVSCRGTGSATLQYVRRIDDEDFRAKGGGKWCGGNVTVAWGTRLAQKTLQRRITVLLSETNLNLERHPPPPRTPPGPIASAPLRARRALTRGKSEECESV